MNEKYKDPRWQKKRLEILNRDNWICQLCGDNGTTLHVHHMCYDDDYELWEVPTGWLITLCKDCHELNVERFYLPFNDFRAVLGMGLINNRTFNDIFDRHAVIDSGCDIRVTDSFIAQWGPMI